MDRDAFTGCRRDIKYHVLKILRLRENYEVPVQLRVREICGELLRTIGEEDISGIFILEVDSFSFRFLEILDKFLYCIQGRQALYQLLQAFLLQINRMKIRHTHSHLICNFIYTLQYQVHHFSVMSRCKAWNRVQDYQNNQCQFYLKEA